MEKKLSMEFIYILPSTSRVNDSMLIAIDQISKIIHFILVNIILWTCDITYIVIRVIVRTHGMLKVIVTNHN